MTDQRFVAASVAAHSLSRTEERHARRARGQSSSCSSGHHARCRGSTVIDDAVLDCTCSHHEGDA